MVGIKSVGHSSEVFPRGKDGGWPKLRPQHSQRGTPTHTNTHTSTFNLSSKANNTTTKTTPATVPVIFHSLFHFVANAFIVCTQMHWMGHLVTYTAKSVILNLAFCFFIEPVLCKAAVRGCVRELKMFHFRASSVQLFIYSLSSVLRRRQSQRQ